ncbi:hypothetical protein [Curvivirga aplysinae]|uniref:hypothetical protein n=1 Tax=Curvivirga aplysinae TaxID=2529852 RepID=UPI0012BD2639|nr:hypothetical protein [Curvivirga aplysinae]MTI08487.1 hypothetical protein [Curvivirga aplysinae]
MGWLQIVMMVAAMVLSEKQASQQRKHQKKQLAAQEARAEEQKKLQMKQEKKAHERRQAQLRAKMGASGTSYGGGSSDAILDGMRKQSRENLLTIAEGYQMDKEIGRLNATDGVGEGLKKTQRYLGYAEQLNNSQLGN